MLLASIKRANRKDSSEFIIACTTYGPDFPAKPASNQVLDKRAHPRSKWLDNLV